MQKRFLVAIISVFIIIINTGCGLSKSIPLTPTANSIPHNTPTQLDEQLIGSLTINPNEPYPVEIKTGGVYEFFVYRLVCCEALEQLQVDVLWSVEPKYGTDFDARYGILTIDTSTPNGSIFIVTANIEHGKRYVSTKVIVYNPEENPLVGSWKGYAQLSCIDRQWILNDSKGGLYYPIGNLSFFADGRFNMVWFPSVGYLQYSGTYTYNLNQGSLVMSPTQGEYTPRGIDGTGRFSLDQDGNLVLTDIWLGIPQSTDSPTVCGYIFKRY